MPPADAGTGHILIANEGLTALATIMPPTFVGSEFRSPLARQLPICRGVANYAKAFVKQARGQVAAREFSTFNIQNSTSNIRNPLILERLL